MADTGSEAPSALPRCAVHSDGTIPVVGILLGVSNCYRLGAVFKECDRLVWPRYSRPPRAVGFQPALGDLVRLVLDGDRAVSL